MKVINIIYSLLFIISSFYLFGCDSDKTSVNDQSTSKEFFESRVVSVLEDRCLSCHGVQRDAYDQFMADENKTFFYFPITENNKISDVEVSYKASISHGRVGYGDDARFSHILRSPLTE